MLPLCCGREMKVRVETSRFYEVECGMCRDSVYVKKGEEPKPVMLDD